MMKKQIARSGSKNKIGDAEKKVKGVGADSTRVDISQ